MFTYRQLQAIINNMDEEQLDSTVTIMNVAEQECWAVTGMLENNYEGTWGVLDEGIPVLKFNDDDEREEEDNLSYEGE